MDHSGDSGDESAWPGYVDILSTVLIMFVFFVMIMAVAMFVLSLRQKEFLEKENEKKLSEQVSKELREVIEKIGQGNMTVEELQKRLQSPEQLEKMSEQNTSLKKENIKLNYEVEELNDAIDQIKADLSDVTEQSTVESNRDLVVMYVKNDIALSDETEAMIAANIKKALKGRDPSSVEVKLVSSDNPNAPTISVSRELSLARSLNVRNVILKEKIAAQNVSIHYIDSEMINDSYNWVKIIVEDK